MILLDDGSITVNFWDEKLIRVNFLDVRLNRVILLDALIKVNFWMSG